MQKVFYLIFGVFFIFSISSSVHAQSKDTTSSVMDTTAIKPFNNGLDKMQKADYKGALADFEQALAASKDYRIYYQMAVAEEKLGNHEAAIKDYEGAIKAKPDFDASYNDLGNVYYNTGNYKEAINNFEKFLEMSKNDTVKEAVKFNLALSYTTLSTSAEKSKNSKLAIQELKKAVGYYNYDIAYLDLARIYFVANQFNNAIEAAQNALKYRKNIGEGGPYYYMGIAYSKKNDLKKAKECLLKAKDDPTYAKFAQQVLDGMK